MTERSPLAGVVKESSLMPTALMRFDTMRALARRLVTNPYLSEKEKKRSKDQLIVLAHGIVISPLQQVIKVDKAFATLSESQNERDKQVVSTLSTAFEDARNKHEKD